MQPPDDQLHAKSGPEVVGISPGGSRMLKYGSNAVVQRQTGYVDESVHELREQREKLYVDLFGECESIFHELMPFVPHIDVLCHSPTNGRPYFTYVTSGMSDVPMTSPPNAGPNARRVELVFYADADKPEYAEVLRRLALFPHEARTWIHWGHSMPNGNPPQAVFGIQTFKALFFMPSIIHPDLELGQRLQWKGEPINLVWVVPITEEECKVKLQVGTNALYTLFEMREHPAVFLEQRESYI